MAVSPSSSVQRARQQLAERLREIRLDAGLTARALSAAAGWHEAKTSRIESAKQVLTDADIQIWCLRPRLLDHPGRCTLLHALPGRSTGFKHCSSQSMVGLGAGCTA
jgi:hypothetical protein